MTQQKRGFDQICYCLKGVSTVKNLAGLLRDLTFYIFKYEQAKKDSVTRFYILFYIGKKSLPNQKTLPYEQAETIFFESCVLVVAD